MVLQINPARAQAVMLKVFEHHVARSCQNGFSIFPLRPVQACSFWQKAYIKRRFHRPVCVCFPASTPCCFAPRSIRGVYKKENIMLLSRPSPQSSLSRDFFFFLNQNGELQDGQKQEQPFSPPTTDQSCNKREAEGHLIHIWESLPTPFPLPHALNTLQF